MKPVKMIPLFSLMFLCAVSLVAGTALAAPADSIPTTGLSLWLKASEVEKDAAGYVSKWLDLSGNNNHATGAAKKPLFVADGQNGNPVLRFTGTEILDLAKTITMSTYTVFIAYKFDTPTMPFQFILSGEKQGFMAGGNYGDPVFHAYGVWRTNSPTWHDQWLLATEMPTTFSVITATNESLYRNGVMATLGVIPLQYAPYYGKILGLAINRVGGHPHATLGPQNFIGDLAEILIYNTTLTPAVRSHVENYLLTKYAIGSSQPAGKQAADVQKAADDAAAKAAADAKKAADEAIAAQASATAASDAESLLAKIMDWIKSGKLDEADTQLKALEGKSGSLPASVQQTIKSTRDSLTAAQKAKSTLSLPAGVPGLPK